MTSCQQDAQNAVVGRLLLIVSRDAPRRFAYLKHIYGSETVEVIIDRRVGERRRHHRLAVNERRWATRRHRDVTEEMNTFGWSLVRR